MNELALFAGVGGGLIASHRLGWRPVCAVEKEPYCREVLLKRQQDGLLPLFPVWDDVHTFEGRPWRGIVQVVTAGFPCQPFSLAGKRRGKDDDRNLWPETIRIIREVGPRLALLENVPGLMAKDYFGEILGDLAEAGFDARWEVVSARDVGAPHLRNRLWILAAHPDRGGFPKLSERDSRADSGRQEGSLGDDALGLREAVAHPDGQGLEHVQEVQAPPKHAGRRWALQKGWWDVEPAVGRVADGVSNKLDKSQPASNGEHE